MTIENHIEGVVARSELREETFRRLVATTVVSALVILLCLSLVADEESFMVAWALWFGLAIVGLVSRTASRNRIGVAELTWHLAMAGTVAGGVAVYAEADLGYLLALLPLSACLTSGGRGGAVAEALVIGVGFALYATVGPGLVSATHIVGYAVSALFAGVIGWAAHDVLYTVTEWSQRGFEQARKSMDDARKSRGQLAQVLVDLDRAYYRLERTNAALVAAWRASSESERFRARFANTLSHELRTPLDLIIGFSEMMVMAPEKYGEAQLPAAYRSDLNVVYRNAQHLLRLVDDVLDLGSSDVGQLPLHKELTDMDKLVTEAISMVREYIEAKGLDLEVSLDSNLSEVSIDPLRIRQVILNLLVNAARFTERGYIKVAVHRDEHQIVVRIRDTGRGIQQRDLPLVFQEFTTDEGHTDRGWTGSGLGLPISKRLVELHGGDMRVESVFQEGSVFAFTLPLDSDTAQSRPATSRLESHVPRPVLEDKRLIVATDCDAGSILALQRLLRDYRIEHGGNRTDAVALANEGRALAMLSSSESRPPGLGTKTIHMGCRLMASRRPPEFGDVQQVLQKPVTQEELWWAIEALGRPVSSVLIADDDIDTLRLLRRMLYPRIVPDLCYEAHDGLEALRVIAERKPDLLVLDLVMPEMDGYAVLRELGKRDDESVPVIVMTAQDSVQTVWTVPGRISVAVGEEMGLGSFSQTVRALLTTHARGWH